MNRGHLIGYQFSGVNDEGKNLVPMTAWLNSGNYKGTDEDNQSGMLYYENRLDNWLALHPNYWLDYKVTAIYSGDELLPRQVELHYLFSYGFMILHHVCSHIRISAAHSLFAAPRSFSQLVTSFIGSQCQGILHMLFFA